MKRIARHHAQPRCDRGFETMRSNIGRGEAWLKDIRTQDEMPRAGNAQSGKCPEREMPESGEGTTGADDRETSDQRAPLCWVDVVFVPKWGVPQWGARNRRRSVIRARCHVAGYASGRSGEVPWRPGGCSGNSRINAKYRPPGRRHGVRSTANPVARRRDTRDA